MGRLMIPGVLTINGRLYYRKRYRADGKRKAVYVPLPPVDDPTFADALKAAKAPATEGRSVAPGSFAALAAEFRAQLAKRELAANTRRNYLTYVDRIVEQHGHRLVRQLRRAHVYKIRDGLADTPGVARNYINVLRLMLEFACERDWRSDNPAARIPRLDIGEHEPWPAEVLEAVLAEATPMMRLAVITGLCSGQRISDCIRLQHAWAEDGIMRLKHKKTRVPVAIPMHPLWLDEIAKVPRKALTILYDRSGGPFNSPEPIQARLRDLMVKAGAGDDYSFHGLRKNACCYLLELGLNDAQVGHLLGMSPDTVRHYGKRARALMVARQVASVVTGGTILTLKRGKGGAN